MTFYDSTTQQGLCQEIDRLCDTTDTTYTRYAKTSRVNNALEEVVGWLINADGTWQFDDTNYTTLPIGTGNLISGQTSYTFAAQFLDIEEVDVLMLSGIYHRLTPFDPSELGMSFEEYFAVSTTNSPTGLPQYYDKNSDSIRIAPAPTATTCTLTNGLKVRFKRTASLFTPVNTTAADTTVPGFASPYHAILAYMASIPYCMTYKKDRVGTYTAKVAQMKMDLIKFYTNREKDNRKVMSMSYASGR